MMSFAVSVMVILFGVCLLSTVEASATHSREDAARFRVHGAGSPDVSEPAYVCSVEALQVVVSEAVFEVEYPYQLAVTK